MFHDEKSNGLIRIEQLVTVDISQLYSHTSLNVI